MFFFLGKIPMDLRIIYCRYIELLQYCIMQILNLIYSSAINLMKFCIKLFFNLLHQG